MMAILEQMVYHVSQFEQTNLASKINDSLAHSDGVTARLIFIILLDWIKDRGIQSDRRPLSLSEFPWSVELKKLIQLHSELSGIFEINGNQFNFNPSISELEVDRAESYVVDNYQPIVMR
jgi:hypothetical protein